MRKLLYFALTVFVAMAVCGCGGNKEKQADHVLAADDDTVADSTIYGTCGDGTTMNVLQLITDKGDTLMFAMNDLDTCTNVQGGLLSGDRLAVLACNGSEGEKFAQTVINLTTLIGKWSDIERSIDIQEGGIVECSKQEPKPYIDWKICNGRLVLTSDTFSIYQLGPDSLLLENAKGIYAYRRLAK